MKTVVAALAVFALTATPALAQDQEKPPEKPKMCEMMHDGKKMQGMMMKDKDGKMTCQMMDHSKMDHSKMDHGQSGHGEKKEAEAAKPDGGHKHD